MHHFRQKQWRAVESESCAPYDLIVESPSGRMFKVEVKTGPSARNMRTQGRINKFSVGIQGLRNKTADFLAVVANDGQIRIVLFPEHLYNRSRQSRQISMDALCQANNTAS